MEQKKKTELTKSKILAAAEQEFSEKGFDAARVDAIAELAGVNKRMIYAHYKSKEGLYTTILDIIYKRLASYEEILEKSDFDGIGSVRGAILKYFEFLVSNPSFVRIVLWENLNNAAYVGNIKTDLFVGIEKMLQKGIDKGIISKSLDIRQTALSFNMFCFSAFSNLHTVSKLIHEDLSTAEELQKRAEHIADVLTQYVLHLGN